MKREITQMNTHPVLREIAQEVPVEQIATEKFQSIINDMHESLATQNDGVAIAAPQIGESYRIFTIAPFIFDQPNKEHLVYINPTITKHSKKSKMMHEGCLSCRWKVGEVQRSVEVSIEAYDERGQKFIESGDGLLGHIFQHETDHLDGILFIDKAENLRDMSQDEIDEVLQHSK